MPFQSQAQRRFMYAKHPGIAKRWERHTPNKKLPEKVPEKTAGTVSPLALILTLSAIPPLAGLAYKLKKSYDEKTASLIADSVIEKIAANLLKG